MENKTISDLLAAQGQQELVWVTIKTPGNSLKTLFWESSQILYN